jgi:hypothetical protein
VPEPDRLFGTRAADPARGTCRIEGCSAALAGFFKVVCYQRGELIGSVGVEPLYGLGH